ncbi:MAG: ABC transporter ATP-binding protein [Myxococcota bacterium]|nr:ABC transporter ATP-binding protein [Myxococcota bacterium]
MTVPALVTRGLTRRFGGRTAVDDLSIEVQEGDTYGFLGPNGAGKTTAIRCILGLIKRDAGDVSIFGESGLAARRHVGAMVETPAFHGWMSGRANLDRAAAFAGVGGREDIDRALELVGLKGREEEAVSTYSLGMRQRLGIARSLVGRPRLLILDEPTNGLDPRGMKEVRDLLARLARTEKLTIFISSHLLAEIEALCSRVGIIEDGRMIAEGEVADLLAGRSSVLEVDVGATDMTALARIAPGLPGVALLGDGAEGRLRLGLEGRTVPQLNRALLEAGIDVEALVPVQKSLEELFLALTRKEVT